MYEDNYPWPIKCGTCLNEFSQEIGRMKAGEELRCPSCKVQFVYSVKEFEREVAETFKLGLDPYRNMARTR